jgi:hypothetical protein
MACMERVNNASEILMNGGEHLTDMGLNGKMMVENQGVKVNA